MPIQKTSPPTLTSDGFTCFNPLSSEDVYTLVTANHTATCSLDPIPSSFQNISHNILPLLATLINPSPSSGLIPAPFKTATVKPLLKKPTQDSADIQNYSPVSLLSFLSKTLECAIYNQLSSYLSQNDLLDPNQSGSWAAHSMTTALPTLTEASIYYSYTSQRDQNKSSHLKQNQVLVKGK